MTRAGFVASAVAGLCLASMPMWRYARWAGTAEAHRNHEPRHGGQLAMVGEYHIELVRRRGSVRVFVSDAWRRPLVPHQGWLLVNQGTILPLAWDGSRLVGVDVASARRLEAVVVLPGGERLATTFDFNDEG